MRTGEGSLTLGSSAFVCDRVWICGGCMHLYKVPSSALYMHFNQMGFTLFLNEGSCLSLKLFFCLNQRILCIIISQMKEEHVSCSHAPADGFIMV